MIALAEDMTNALWVVKLRLRVIAVNQSDFTVANLVFECHRVFVDHD